MTAPNADIIVKIILKIFTQTDGLDFFINFINQYSSYPLAETKNLFFSNNALNVLHRL